MSDNVLRIADASQQLSSSLSVANTLLYDVSCPAKPERVTDGAPSNIDTLQYNFTALVAKYLGANLQIKSLSMSS